MCKRLPEIEAKESTEVVKRHENAHKTGTDRAIHDGHQRWWGEGRSASANPIHQRGRPAARRNANAPLGARSRARASTPRAVPPTPAGSCSERSRWCRDRLQRVETGVSSARLILRPHVPQSEAIQPHGLGLGGVLCGRFVLRTLSPVTADRSLGRPWQCAESACACEQAKTALRESFFLPRQ